MCDIVEIWILHPSRRILVSDFPGPPAEICSFVSEEAQRAAQARGYPTVSEIGFPADSRLGSFPWGRAVTIAEQKAQELGYTVVYEIYEDGLDEDDDFDLYEDNS